MPRPNNRLYDLLEVAPEVTRRGLDAAFTRIADRLKARGTEPANRQLEEVQEAYGVLRDHERRRLYDAHGERAFEPGFVLPAPPTAVPPRMGPAGDGGGGGGGASYPQPMGGSGGGGGGRPPEPRRAPPVRNVGMAGGPPAGPPPMAPPPAAYPPPAHAYPPQGYAAPPNYGAPQGYQQPPPPKQTGPVEVYIPFRIACIGGRQEVLVGDELLEVPVSPGTAGGTIVAYRGRQFVIRVEESETFTRNGLDLHVTVVVDEADAERGTHVVVPTLDSHCTVEVEPGTVDGDKVRLDELGIPAQDGAGDLVVTIVVRPSNMPAHGRVPLKPTKKARRREPSD